jgi:hypothetical protein
MAFPKPIALVCERCGLPVLVRDGVLEHEGSPCGAALQRRQTIVVQPLGRRRRGAPVRARRSELA